MLFSRIVRAAAIVAALAVAGCLLAQSRPPSKQYVVLVKRGPKWAAGKPVSEQALGNHGRYLQEQMTKGALQLAGAFLDDSGGLILYNGKDEAEVRAIAEHDPGVLSGVLAVEWIRPFDLGFDAATGKSPFHAAK
ncbi:MAG TPA: YciI family protein [Candidatus Limnocylindrales bacterium]|nr:YciI family protein [Candidatus Limnocylindrales bacterium]